MELEIFKSSYGYYNLRTNGGRPTEEMVSYLKENGYRWSRNNNCWYPATSEAKEKNLHDDFAVKFQEKFFGGGAHEQKSFAQDLIDRENRKEEWRKNHEKSERTVQLETLVAELREELRRDKEKIARLENELANRNSDRLSDFYAEQEQKQLDEESEWERENTLTEAEEAAIVAENNADDVQLGVSGARQRRMIEEIVEAVEAEAREEEPVAEKKFLQSQECTTEQKSGYIEVSPEELSAAKQMLPTAQYVTTLRFSQGEEGDFFKRQIKDIAAAVKNAPKIGGTDGMEQHPIVFRYFHPTGTETLVTEIGEDGEAYGFQCLNGDYEMAEWGYFNLNEIKNILGMEMDYHVPEGMTVERWLYQEKPDQFPQYAKFAENETAQSGISYTLYQIKEAADEHATEAELRDVRFAGYNDIKHRHHDVKRERYNKVYQTNLSEQGITGNLADKKVAEMIAERIFDDFNAKIPADFHGHSLSVSDIIVMEQDGKKYPFFVDGFGFVSDAIDLAQFIEDDQELYTKSPLAGLTSEEKGMIFQGLWEAEDKGLMDYHEEYFPGDRYPAYPGDMFVEEYLLNHQSQYDFAELKETFLAEEPDEILIEAENGEKMTVDELHAWNEEQKMQESDDELSEGKSFAMELAQDLGNEDSLMERASYRFFVKSTAEFDAFADFEPVTNLSAEEAVRHYAELQEKGISCGIGIHIPNDFIFNDPNGDGTTIFIRNDEGVGSFSIMGDSFIKDLKSADDHAKNLIAAYTDLQQALIKANVDFEYPDFLAEKINELFTTNAEQTEHKPVEISPVTLEEILGAMNMSPVISDDGKLLVFDQLRDEYIDNGMEDDDGKAEYAFSDAADIFARLDIYINDYFIHDMEEQLEAGGVTLRGDETLADLCDYAKKQLEAGIETVSQGELNLAMGIVHPDTVIMPEVNHRTPVENNRLNQALTRNEFLSHEKIEEDNSQQDFNFFQYNGNTYIPFRAFKEAGSLEKYNNENEWITIAHNLDWNNAVLKKENVKDYSVKSFYEAAGGKDKCKADIFYCINNSSFVLPTDAGIAKIDTENVDIDSAGFQYDVELWYAEQFEKGNLGITYSEQKKDSVELTSKKYIRSIREQCREILQKSDSAITEADKLILAQYEGAGGINEENRSNAGILNEFYTPNNLVEKVWQIVDAYAPNAKTVLEPSAGVGKFANNRANNEFTMHELDETSARINRILHPEANVIQGAYQKQFFDDGERFKKIDFEQPKYDVVIGNPPYGTYNDKYKGLGEGKEFDRYEEYFISKGLDALKDENSLLAFVVPSGFLNTASDKQKEIIASKGRLVDAYRLPAGAFPTTEVGTDIILMQSWEKIQKVNENRSKGNENVESRKEVNLELLSNGDWFKQHPEKVLGEVKTRTNRFGKVEEYVAVHEGLTVQDELDKIDGFLPKVESQMTVERHEKEPVTETTVEKTLQEKIYDQYIVADITPAFSDKEGYARKISQEIAAALETKRSIDIGTIRTHLSMKNDKVSFEEKKLVKAIFEENTGLKLPEFVNDYEAFDTQMNQVIDSWAKDSRKQDKLQTKAIRTIRGFYNGDSAFEARLDHIADVIRDADMTSTDSVVMVRMIADFDTDSSHYENQRAYETAVSDVISQFEKMESVFAQNIPLQEAQPEKAKSSRPKKEKWNITKSKGEVMTAQEFSRLYGKDFDEREFPIWRATDWQGNIDLAKLSAEDMRYLHESGNYVQKNLDEWTHKVLFTSGDIYAKIEEQKKLRDDAIDRHGENADSAKNFAENIALLESVRKPLLDMEHIHLGVKTTLAEEFTTTHLDSDGNLVELNLQESFILWAQNATLAMGMWRGDIDFATANISREELGEELSFRDIVAYIDGEPVKAEAVRGWRTYSMSEEEKAAEKAERKKEADLKRQERSDTANRLFDRYLHEGLDDATRTRLVAEYNRRFNSYIIPDYSKLPLFVDGMSASKGESKFKLYDQQIKGISFLCNKGNGLFAYDVGVGKTAAGIVATVNQIQTRRSRRPLIVVPNQVYAKWYTDIKQLFPNTQVNDLYNFNKDSVGAFVNKENPHKLNIPKNTISLCTYEALKNITFTDRSCENELFEDFASLLSADFDGSDRENAESADKIKGIIGSASHVKDASYYFFENCGFDNLTVDEAHNFKNLWVVPRPKKKGQSNEYAGIPSGKPSARALKMYGMTQLVQRYNDDRNVFMLTATPFMNSPTEVYSMLSYIGRERLRKAGISSLRSFFDQFAQTKQELGVTSTGSVDTKQVMKSWKELPALQAILTEFIDKVDGEEAGIIRPNKFTHVKPLDMSELQKQMREIDEERMSEVKEGNSAAVIVAMNNMRLSCVAPALANPAMYPGVTLPPLSQLVETSPKLKFVCDAIIDMYKGNPEKGQFMYVPLGKESHGIIKEYLVKHGIPKEAVEIINGEINNTPEKKEKITARFNDEKHPCKIIIGGKNTSEGIDLNGNSFVMYNCSLGWNPSETIQTEGRIWRQGNLQGNVHVVYPVMNDSIDSVLYQKHDEKRSRINELWNYKGDSLNVEDINPEDLKLDLIKDPQKKAKLILMESTKEARAELSKINLRIKSFDDIVEKRKALSEEFENAKRMVENYEKQIETYKSRGFEVSEWIKTSMKEYKKVYQSSESKLAKISEKFASLNIANDDDMMAYIRNINAQKKVCEEKIEHAKENLPEILRKLELERLEQKVMEYPIEKQREILEADILNNLRPMKEVAYEIKTMRFEKMIAEKLKAGDITQSEHDLYKKAGYEKYEQWQNGEIESLEEIAADRHVSVEERREEEKTERVEITAQSGLPANDQLAQIKKENAASLADDEGGLFFNLAEDEMFVHSTERGYAKSYEKPYFNAGNDDFTLTPEQLTKSELKRDEIVLPILNGKETGMYKAFNDFAKHGVFDVVGTQIDFCDQDKISAEGWEQLHAAMNIYRSKEFETMRYVLIDRMTGEIRDQLAVSSHMPNVCHAGNTADTIKSLISRAEEKDCLIVAVHNHPSGNILESKDDIKFTKSLEEMLTRTDGFSRFAGHIILDHDTFNLYTPEKGWNVKIDWDNVGREDELLNKDFSLKNSRTDTTGQLMSVAEKVNDTNNWNDKFVPVLFSDTENKVTGLKFYDKSFFDKTPQQIRNELQFAGIEAGATRAFPVFTQSLSEKMTPIESMFFEDKLKNLVAGHAFTDAALPQSTVVEKYDIKPGLPFFDEHDYRAKHPDVEKTWETRINPTLFQQMQLGTLKITVPEEEQFRQPKPHLKKAACMGY
ncbi:YodL domain-containing protein [Treponema sp.]|uniref:YodL domain-containing protein n=1 Tax=Treponema sp. TaxID=166 RepID=UPI0025EAABBB|nr:YodL domain-containing protein [Treponema sp.]